MIQNQIRILVVPVRVVVLQVIERVVVLVPWFDHYTLVPVPLCCGL